MPENKTTPLQTLYEGLAGKNPQLKERGFDAFQSDMQSEDNLRKLFDGMSVKNPQLKQYGFDAFKTDMFPEPVVEPDTELEEAQKKFTQNPRALMGMDIDTAKQVASNSIDTPVGDNSEFGGFGTELGKRAHRSALELNKMLANTPDFINQLAVEAWNTSPPGKAVEKIGDMLGKNWKMEAMNLKPKKYNQYNQEQKELLTKKIAELNPKHEQGIIESAKKGDWTTFTRNLAGGVADSFAPSIAMMVSGGSMGTAGMIGSSAAVFGAGNYLEMDENAPQMDESTKVLASLSKGALEGIFETYLGSGAVGGALRKVIVKEGKEAGQKMLMDGLRKGFSDLLTKYPALAPMGEGFEEWGTQVTQNYVDIISGYRPDISVFDGSGDALLIGIASGASHSAPLYAAKGIVGSGEEQAPTASNPEQPTPTVDPQQQVDAMRNQFMQESEQQADLFQHENGSFIQVTDKSGKQYFVTKGELESADGLLFAINEQGEEVQLSNTDIAESEVIPGREAYITQRLEAFEAQLQQIQNNSVTIEGQRYLVHGEVVPGEIALQPIDELGNPTSDNITSLPAEEFANLTQDNVNEVAETTPPEAEAGGVSEQPTQKIVSTVQIGKNNYKYTNEEDGSFAIQLEEGQDPVKAEKEIRATLPDDQQNRIQLVQDQVTIPASVPWQKPTAQTVTKGIIILPETIQEQNANEFTESANNLENQEEKLAETETPQAENEMVDISETGESLQKEIPTNESDLQINNTVQDENTNEQTASSDLQEGQPIVNEEVGTPMVNETLPVDKSNEVNTESGANGSVVELNEQPEASEPDYNQKKNIVLDYFGGMYADVVESNPQYIYENVPEVNDREAEQIYNEIKSEFEAEKQKTSNNPLFKTPLEQKLDEAKPLVEEKQSVKQAEKEVNTNPTEGQKKAGNYKKGHAKFGGFNITIENPKGSTRSGKDAKGKKWSITLNNNYGYFKRTLGKDGDQVDFFLGPNNRSHKVYVVDQVDPNTFLFDEHKVMLGFNSEEEARTAYLSNYEEGWQGLGAITEMHKNDFKKWLNVSGKKKRAKRKPVSELVQVKRKTKKNSLTPEQVQERKENRAKALTIEPVSLEQLILQYIVQGNRLNWGEIQKEVFPSSRSEMNRRIWMLKGDAPTIDELLVKQGIVSGTTFEQEAQETNVFRNAVLDVVLSNTTQNDMVNRILEIGSNEQNDIELQENALGEAMAAAEKAEIDFANSVWDEYYDELVKNEDFPSDNELNNLFLLDNGTEESNTEQGAVQGENEQDSSTESPGGGQVVKGGSSRNATQATPEEVNPNQEKIDKAQTELTTLQSRLKKKEAEINSRNGIFGDTASKPGGLFVDEQFDMANAKQVVEGIKAEITKKEQEIEQLTKAGETAAIENAGQQEIPTERKIKSWDDRWAELKAENNPEELDKFYNKVKVALNGYAQGKGEDVVKEFESLKNEIEDYAESIKNQSNKNLADNEVVSDKKETSTVSESNKNQETFKTPLEKKIEEAGEKVKSKKAKGKKSFSEQVKKNLSEKDGARLDELRNQLRNKLGGQLNAGLDPETFMLAAEATGLVIKSGARAFSQYASTMVDMLGEKITPHLKALYEYTRRADSAEYAEEMTPTTEVDNADIEQIISELDENSVTLQKEENVSDRSGNSESSSSDSESEVRSDETNVSGDRGRSGSNGNGNSQSGRTGNRKRPSSQGSLDLFAPVTGERGTEQEQNQPESESTRDSNTEGSKSDSSTRNNVERDGNQSDGTDVAANTTTPGSFAERVRLNLIKQREAEDIPVKLTDRANISETLPFLLEDQQDDVFKTEKRFNNPEHQTHDRANGKGMLFTNGTGTGKTYTGLGIVKRFTKQGKNRILIVVPTQPKVTDWIKDGKNLGLDITALKDTKDKGEGTVITTYANMRANLALLEDDFDLVMYDESHRLMEDKKGSPSSTTYTHYNLTNKTEGHALQRIQEVHPLWLEARELNRKIRKEEEYRSNPDLMDQMYFESKETQDEYEAQLEKVKAQQKEVLPSLEKRAAEAYKRTKVVFLSATPFKMHFNLRYANGYLFDWGEEITYESASRGMSRVDPESRFFLDNFGSAYEWKYHRLQQKSDANPEAIAMQEVEFAEKLMKQGVMSGRAIESDMDYSREFPKVALANADLFNRGFNDIYKWGDDAEFDGLRDAAHEIFYNYNYTTKLFESLKTSMSIPRIQQHIDLGRKVVVFHRRRQAGVAPPFRSILALTRSRMNAIIAEKEAKAEEKEHAKEVLAQCDLFAERYSDLLDYEQTLNYNSAIDQILEEFGSDRVRFINGNVSKKDKNQAVKDFNDDNSGVDIIMVQEESGKEGISLHDTSGKHQRALISLSMPISSITALQIEGRIFRIGNESNAIFEYPLLGLDLEVAAFGQSINRKLSTTENLAVGNQSRDLLRSFAEGVLFNSTTDAPNQEQGQGGKEYDKKELELKSEFQRAKLVYSTNQKQRGRRDQRKGVDYYPTPEPVGQKMVEWLGLREGDEVLEPSAGHGAIAMWFPSNAKGTVIEPSFELFSKLTARTGDAKKVNTTFEEHNIVNKYDGVVMNPPFGQGGSTAIKHIEKAYKHLRPNGRIVALIPNGGSMQKKFDKFLYGEDEKGHMLNPDAYLVAEMVLPSVTFEQAGTSVNGKIVVIDKLPVDKTERQIRQEVREVSNQQAINGGVLMTPEEINQEVARRMVEQRPNIYASKHDFSGAKTIDELFDEIEYTTIVPRMKPFKGMQEVSNNVTEETSTPVEEVEGEGKVLHPVEEYEHTKTGATLYNVRLIERTDRFKELADIARKHSPYNKRKAYSPYSKGFLFSTKEHAIRFRNEVEGNEESPKFRIDDQLKENLTSADLDKRHAANVELINHINQLTGNVAETKVVKTVSDLYNDLRAEGVSEKALDRLQKEVEQAGERVINGLFFRDKVWIVSENHGKQRNILNTWLHEMTHRIVDSEFTKEELEEIYDNLGKEFIEDNIPDIHHNDPKDKQVHELLAYSYETGANSIESVFNGEVDFDHFPLTLQFAINRITERFKEYGFRETENTKPTGRGTDALQRNSEQESSRQLRQDSEGEPGTTTTGRTGESQGNVKPDKKDYPFLPDYLDALEEYKAKGKNQKAKVPQTETPEFKKWFGDSKVVDENGKPLVVYHGTPYVFDEFSHNEKGKRTDHNSEDVGFHFSNDPEFADTYAGTSEIKLFEEYSRMFGELPERYSANVKPNIMPVYLSIQNPFIQKDSFVIDKDLIEQAKANGHDGIFAQVGDRTEYVAFEPSQIKSATGNNGGFDPNNPDIRFSTSEKTGSNFLDDVLPKAAQRYEDREKVKDFKKTLEYIREFWQDINLPIRRLEEEVIKRGGKLYNKAKPYRDINLSFGRMEELYRQFTEQDMTPILEAVRDLVKSGKDNSYVLPYIISKHAVERNREMRMAEFDAWIEANEEATPEERAQKLENLGKKDYSGVRGFDPENKYDNPDQLAEEIVEEFELNADKKLIDNLWEKIGNATGQILEHWRKGGQISEKQYNKYKAQYKYFVPLRGWRHGAAKQLRYSKGEGFGASLRHAEGRKSLADNPLAYMQAVAFKSIGERVTNEINQSLLNLVMTNYDREKFSDLYSVKKIYYVKGEQYNTETGQMDEVWDPTLVKPTAEQFAAGEAKTEYYKEHMKLRSHFEGFQHEVIVHREDGDVAIVFSDDQLGTAQAFNRQNTLYELRGKIYDASDLSRVARVTGGFGLTNFMKGMFTSLNPVFPFTNAFRDVPEAAFTLWIQDGNGKVPKNIPAAFNTVRKRLWGKEKGTSDLDKKLNDFYEVGGPTGFTHEKGPEEIEKDLKKELKRILQSDGFKGKTVNKVLDVFTTIQKWNQLFEDTTRFAVYLSSLEAGKSKEDAAMDAKEASVNFNRKGKGTKLMDSIWAFFNPAIQAAQKNFKLAKDQPKRFAQVAGSVAVLGFMEAMLNDLGDGDDDEYYDLNEYVRQNYAVIGWGEKYLRIPLPQFWRGFHSLGVISYDLFRKQLTGNDSKTTIGKAGANTMLNFIGGLSPIDIPGFWVDGEFSISPMVPTWAKPVYEVNVTNRDFMHNTIAKEPFTKALEEQLAESSLHKKNVNPAVKAITDFLAKDVGGRYGDLKVDVRDGKIKKLNWWLDWNPSKIEHILTSYFGGAGRVASDFTTTLLQLAMREEEVDFNNVPFVNSFIRNTPDNKWGTINEWYELKDMASDFNAVRNYAKRNRDIEKLKDVSESELMVISKIVKAYDDSITRVVKAYGMSSDEGSQKVVELMEDAMELIDETIKE